jgi:maleylpyruvate isomerase
MKWLRERVAGQDEAFTRQFLTVTMARLEEAVADGAGRFCHGDEVTLADLFVVPQLFGARRFGVDVSRLPTLLRVEASCAVLPAFQAAEPERQPDAPLPAPRSP